MNEVNLRVGQIQGLAEFAFWPNFTFGRIMYNGRKFDIWPNNVKWPKI